MVNRCISQVNKYTLSDLIIYCSVNLFCPQNPDLHGWEIQKNSTQVIMGVVHVILTPTLPTEIRHEAAEVSLGLGDPV